MASLDTLKQALATTVGSVTGLRVFPTFQSQINPPTAIIMPGRGQLMTFDTIGPDLVANVTYQLQVILLVSYAEDASSQAAMDAYLNMGSGSSASSVIDAILLDPTLGHQVSYCVPHSVVSYGLTEWAGQQYFGCTIICQVMP